MVDEPAGDPARDAFPGVLVDFARELRRAGLPLGPGDSLVYTAGLALLDPADLLDVYWAGRTTLVTRREHIPTYDRVFRRFFLDEGSDLPEPVRRALRSTRETAAILQVPATDPGSQERQEEQVRMGLIAADAEVLRHKAFAAATPDELAAVRRIIARLRLAPPRRRTRRTVTAPKGRLPDQRRIVRAALRSQGDPSTLYWRGRKRRQRPLILILDVSGSMADYSRHLLQFAFSARRATARVEAFCFGTRLTRITPALQRRRVDDAMERAARTVFDWEGGTRIGESLRSFVRDFGRRGTCRGGIVVICSDGLDRGDPEVLATAMERLSRLCHRVVWLNPHWVAPQGSGGASSWPATLGMMVVAPYVDVLLSGRDLASLEEFAARVGELG